MKKLLVPLIAGVVLAITAVAENTSVTSKNTVGFAKKTYSSGLHLVSTPLDTGDDTPSSVFGDSFPLNSKIYVYDVSTGYRISEYRKPFMQPESWSSSVDIGQFVGYWIDVPQGSGVDCVVSGSVNLADSVTNRIVEGFQLLSYPYPVEKTVKNLGFSPSLGDEIYKYDGNSMMYSVSKYAFAFPLGNAWSADFVIAVGEGFWYSSKAMDGKDWVVEAPLSLN